MIQENSLRMPKKKIRVVMIFITLTLLGLLTLVSCATPQGILFEPTVKAYIWPAAPETPRVRYVGELKTSDDLKPGRSGLEGLGDKLFGKDPARQLVTPYALCTDGKDRLFVADTGAQVLQVFNFKTREFQQWVPGPKEELFGQPVAVIYDPIGRIIVSDSVQGVLFVFDEKGKVIAQFGKDFLKRPCGLAIQQGTRRIYVADALAHQILILSPEGKLLERIGARGIEPGEFNYPIAVALDSQGRMYVSDALNFRVQFFDAQHKPVRQIGKKGDLPGYFAQPKGLAVDSHDRLFAMDAQFESLQIFDDQGSLLLALGEEGRKPGEFWLPAGVCFDAQTQRIWIADSYNRRVQVFEMLPEIKP